MKGTAKSKVVTSGRLTGGVKVQQTRRRVTPAAGPEPAYSLYSTDSEDQVTSLHQGLDRCAALLSGILQAEKPSPPRAVKGGGRGGGGGGAAKPRPAASVGKRPIKKLPLKTGQRSVQAVRRGASSTAQKQASPGQHPTSTTTISSSPPPGQAAPEAAQTHIEEEEEEEEVVPVRDVNTVKASSVQLEPEEKVKTVQYLLGELKALITGQGSVAERLLSYLEQTVSSPLINAGGSNTETEADVHIQNAQLHRRVKILNQQLKERERAERQPNVETLCHSEVVTLQEELSAAQSRLQELQDELTGAQRALQDTQRQLRDTEVERELIRTDLSTTQSRLLDSEREKSELTSVAQQRLEEIRDLKRTLQSQDSSHRPPAVDGSASDQQQHRADPAERHAERITHFLLTLGQLEPKHTDTDAPEPPERDGNTPDPDRSRCSAAVPSCGWRQSQCGSVLSDWSARSGSTFDTRDEAAFRDGLAALDASIASLQRTIQLDLGR